MSQSVPDMYLRRAGRDARGRRPEQALKRTRHQTAVALGSVPLFGDFSKKHLERLAKETDDLEFQPGERIVDEGSPGEALFVVLQGTGKVVRAGRVVGHVVPGDFFGELSAIDGGPRTASVVAETPMVVLRLFRRTLITMLEQEPHLVVKLLSGITRRLREVQRATG
jgi:CRP/FNR family transcriptional regulator, cyclic AMP receptor protein